MFPESKTPTVTLTQYDLGEHAVVAAVDLIQANQTLIYFKPQPLLGAILSFLSDTIRENKVLNKYANHFIVGDIRDEPNGKNRIKLQDGKYEVKKLVIAYPNELQHDKTEIAQDIINRFTKCIKHKSFRPMYINSVNNTFVITKMLQKLKEPNCNLWPAIEVCEEEIEQGQHLDDMFTDETIKLIVQQALPKKYKQKKWYNDSTIATQLYKNGKVPSGIKN